jgi:hypothetical protein
MVQIDELDYHDNVLHTEDIDATAHVTGSFETFIHEKGWIDEMVSFSSLLSLSLFDYTCRHNSSDIDKNDHIMRCVSDDRVKILDRHKPVHEYVDYDKLLTVNLNG